LIFDAQPFAALGIVRQRAPSSFGPAAPLAHWVAGCRFRLSPRLFSAGEEELQV
jgi:hypothetical protein